MFRTIQNETLLEDSCVEGFESAKLQIQSDSCINSRSPSSIGDESESVAKLSPTHNSATDLKGASVANGTEMTSPLTSIPRRISEKLKRSWSVPKTDMACQIPPVLGVDEARYFFTFRNGIVENAVKECMDSIVESEKDGEVIGNWLLTEISLWDNEKERLVLLTTRVIITVKYDFIALKILHHRKIPLKQIDTIVIGDMVYPNGSLVPSRNVCGVRAMWNHGEPLAFKKKWNPFDSEVPLATYTSHPLLWHKEPDMEGNNLYDVEDFTASFVTAVERAQYLEGSGATCRVEHKSIVLENYLGVSSLIHNKNALGFFKVRGKFSF